MTHRKFDFFITSQKSTRRILLKIDISTISTQLVASCLTHIKGLRLSINKDYLLYQTENRFSARRLQIMRVEK